MEIGFIGLGIMGQRMAANLLKGGIRLSINNRTKTPADDLISQGAVWFDSPAELVASVDVVFTMLSTPGVVADIAIGENGFLYNMRENSIWVDCTTVNPSFSRALAERAQENNVLFLDAPVAGSAQPAASGDLVFLVGGPAQALERITPALSAMGRKIIHAGVNGQGSSLKMVINSTLAVSMASFCEAVHLGLSLGLDKDMLLDSLSQSPVVAPIVSRKINMLRENDFPAEFPLEWMYKDLFLASESAYENGVSLPISAAVKEVYARAISQGLAREDFSAVWKAIAQEIP